MATTVLNNGIFLRDNTIDFGTDWDTYHMRNMMKDQTPTNLGPVEFWIQTQQIQAPIYSLTQFKSSSIISVNDMEGRYTWQVPVVNDMPHITRDVDPSNTQKGRGGEPFKIALNRRAYGLSSILTYDKFAGLEMFVMDIQDYSDNEFVYTVRLVNNNNDSYLSNDILKPQTPIFRVTSAMGEYGENYDNVTTRASYRDYYNYCSNAEANFTFNVTGRAAYIMHNKSGSQKGLDIKEIWKFQDPEMAKDVSMVGIPTFLERLGKTELLKKMQDGTIFYNFCTALEMKGMEKIAYDIETYGMWGKGGTFSTDGRDNVRLVAGIWRQMDTSYKRTYSIGSYVPDILETQIYNFFNGRADMVGPDPQRKLMVQTGQAGMRQYMDYIKKMANNAGLVQNASDIGAVTGKPLELKFGYAYTSYVIPFVATVQFVVNPAFDNVQANERENPMVNGYRLSSYCYIVFDVTDNVADNIFQLQNTNLDYKFNWYYVNGNYDYLGRNGHAANSTKPGFDLFMKQMLKTYWIKDPTKILKLVPINPVTKLPFGSFTY
jgi:hypothetical protein